MNGKPLLEEPVDGVKDHFDHCREYIKAILLEGTICDSCLREFAVKTVVFGFIADLIGCPLRVPQDQNQELFERIGDIADVQM